MGFIDDITAFLETEAFCCTRQMREGFEVICVKTLDGRHERIILPLDVSAHSSDESKTVSEAARSCIDFIRSAEGYPVIITEDRWNSQQSMTRARLLAHLQVFSQAFARNCEVRRIEKPQAEAFLRANHSYGPAACRYRYGLFLKRQTGHLAADTLAPGTLIAVATFSNARRWIKGDREIRSYEWTRYASLPGLRVSGGMGKMLKSFIDEVGPDDIMSYADLEWSQGNVYQTLGFTLEGQKEPVLFSVDTDTWTRVPLKPGMTGNLFFRNFGSNKYRLKLTDYE